MTNWTGVAILGHALSQFREGMDHRLTDDDRLWNGKSFMARKDTKGAWLTVSVTVSVTVTVTVLMVVFVRFPTYKRMM